MGIKKEVIKNVLPFLIGLIIPIPLFSQIGINTDQPYYKSALHIDAKGNNTSSITITDEQSTDDVMIDINGNVGLGTVVPEAKFSIVSNSGQGLKIVDGNQQSNYVMMSDSQGYGTWQEVRTSPELIEATQSLTGLTSLYSNPQNSGAYLDLTPGYWLIKYNILWELNKLSGYPNATTYIDVFLSENPSDPMNTHIPGSWTITPVPTDINGASSTVSVILQVASNTRFYLFYYHNSSGLPSTDSRTVQSVDLTSSWSGYLKTNVLQAIRW